MSVFVPGTGGTLKSAKKPAALFEMARVLDAAENSRNGANPGIPAKQNLTVTVDFGTRTAAIAATLPITATIGVDGKPILDVSDYLGAPYSTFVPGPDGDLKSTDIPSAFLELAQIVSNAEKAVTPVDDQPNNVQITYDLEAGNVTIAGTLPITTASEADGDVVIQAVDYLP